MESDSVLKQYGRLLSAGLECPKVKEGRKGPQKTYHPGTNLYMHLCFSGGIIFLNARSYSYSFNFRGINYYSIQFEQAKCTLSGSYTVTVFSFLRINSAIQAGIVS